ncbi:hypothetical protein ACHAXN_007603 [Cyclotella atomus]
MRSSTSCSEVSPLPLEVFFPTSMPFFSPRSLLLPSKQLGRDHLLMHKTGFSKIRPSIKET